MKPYYAVGLAYFSFVLFLLSGLWGRPRAKPVVLPNDPEQPEAPETAPVLPQEEGWIPSYLPGYFFVLWSLLSLYSKLLLEHEWLTSSMKLDARDWIWTLATACTAVAVIVIVSGRRLVWALWLASAVISLLFWIDVIYLRYFDDVPGIYMLNGLTQAPAAAPSGWAMREVTDLWLFADLFLPLLWLLLVPREARARAYIPRVIGVQWLVALTAYHGISFYRLDDDERRLFRLRFRNMAIVEEIGLLNYHAYDILQMVQSRWVNLVDRTYDKELLDSIISESRKSMAQETPYRGKFKGRNLLVIQLESLEAFVIDLKVDGQEIMPFLNQLKKKCLWGALQDQTGQGRSSDGEFVYNNSLLPPGERPLVFAYPSNHYFGLPAVLNEKGYYTLYAVPYWGSFWNCRFMSEQYGFRHHMLREEFRPAEAGETIGWGLTDRAIFARVIPHLQELPKPFYCYAVTMMGHHPYDELEENEQPMRLPSVRGTMLDKYLNCCRVRDDQLRDIVAQLKSSGLWDSTVVVMVGDHDARIPDKDMALLTSDGKYDKLDKLTHDQVACLIHCPGDRPRGRFPQDAVQVDLPATLVHLLGAYDVSTCFFGRSLIGPRQQRERISMGGYGLDEGFAVTDEVQDFKAYSLRDHEELDSNAPCHLKDETHKWFKLVFDFLRMDLVPQVRNTQ